MLQGFLAAVAVIGLPALIVGVALSRLCGTDPDSVVLGPPAGLAVVLLGLRLCELAGGGGWALTATAAVIGLVALPFALRNPRDTWVRISAPVVGAGLSVGVLAWPWTHLDGAGVLGYNVANDSTKHGARIASLVDGLPVQVDTAYAQTVSTFLGGYPSGGHLFAAAAVEPAAGVVAAYNPVMATMMAFAAFPAYWLVRRCGGPVAIGIIAGPLVAAGYLQVAYYLESFLPQMMAGATLLAALALGYEAVASRRVAPAALAGACLAVAVQAYSANILLWSLPLIVVAIGARLAERSRPGLRILALQFAAAAGALLVVMSPVLLDTWDYLRATSDVAGSQTEIGNIRAPLDPRTLFGAFVAVDYREAAPIERTATNVGSLAALILACAGVAISLARRRFALVTILSCYILATLLVIRTANVYYEAKTYQLLAMAIAGAVAVGAGGLLTIGRGKVRIACALAGLALLGVHLNAVRKAVGLEIAERAIRTSDQVSDLPGVAARIPSDPGISLLVEDWVKALLPPADSPFDSYTIVGGRKPVLRTDAQGTSLLGGNWADFDAFEPSQTSYAKSIVEYRLATFSTPPPGYRLAYQTPRLRAWERKGEPPLPTRIPLELPGVVGTRLLAPGASIAIPAAAGSRFRLAARPADGALLMAVRDLDWEGSNWVPWEGDASYLRIQGGVPPVPATATVDLPIAGSYRIMLGGGVQREDAVVIDGTRFPMRERTASGSLPSGAHSVQYLGSIELEAGAHRVELEGAGQRQSVVRAISLELEDRPPPAPVCIGAKRYEVAWNQPAVVSDVPAGARIENCGDLPLLLDWIEPLPE